MIAIVLALACLFFFFGPSFLIYDEKPVKSDAIILFCGDYYKTRERAAEKLLLEGYARYLIVPLYDDVQHILPEGRVVHSSPSEKPASQMFHMRKAVLYEKYYEDTHVELLEGKRIMDEMGLHSIILVSSPYHMKRIKLIADMVFSGPKYSFKCVPTPYERPFAAGDWFDKANSTMMFREYAKLVWFFLYRAIS